MTAAIVLAGGASSRMGRPKALLDVAGVPMVAWVVRCAREVCDEVLVVGARDAAEAAGAAHVADELPGSGPLGALASGFAATDDDRVLALACDMPFVDASCLARLAGMVQGWDAVVPHGSDGRLQVLHAAYARACEPVARRQLAGGSSSMHDLIGAVRTRRLCLQGPWIRSWTNVNTPEDLQRARAELEP